VPAGFAIQAPARIALDIPGASNGLGRSSVEVNQGNLRSLNVVTAGDRTRLVLEPEDRHRLQGAAAGQIAAGVARPGGGRCAGRPPARRRSSRRTAPVTPSRSRTSTSAVGPTTSGRVMVELPNNQVGVDIRQQGQQLVVEFLKSTLPEGLRRKLDVSDFGTPVQTVTTFQAGDRVRVVIEPKGQWEHSAYQSDNQFVVEVRQQKVDQSKLTQGPATRARSCR
jgi:type IV pilus assembly protein PilQ